MLGKGLIATDPSDYLGKHVLDPSVSTPLMILHASALEANIALMRAFCERHGVVLAPHAKTTLSPEIVQRQRAAGAWAITVANASQAITLDDCIGPRLLIANEVIDPASISWLDATLAAKRREVYCFVDSLDGIASLAKGISHGVLNVLLELGMPGGRAGVRSATDVAPLVEAIARTPSLRLAGIAGFEGIVGGATRTAETERQARDFLQYIRTVGCRLAAAGAFDSCDQIVLTAGGTAYFDLVVEELRGPIEGKPALVVLRSGCYVTHDHGVYAELSPFRDTGEGFRPAIAVLSTVLSCPEPGLAICDMGRRDASFDAGLPAPLWIYRRSTDHTSLLSGLITQKLNDQHAFVSDPDQQLSVGDVVAFGISHPCTTFDKWRVIPIVDDSMRIVELTTTRF